MITEDLNSTAELKSDKYNFDFIRGEPRQERGSYAWSELDDIEA